MEEPQFLLEQLEEQEQLVLLDLLMVSSSSPEAVMPVFPSLPEDWRQYQELLRRIAETLQNLLKEVKIQQTGFWISSSQWLPINEAILELDKDILADFRHLRPFPQRGSKIYIFPLTGQIFILPPKLFLSKQSQSGTDFTN